MTLYPTVVVAFAILGTLFLSVARARQLGDWNRLLLDTFGLAVLGGLLFLLFGFPFPIPYAVAKGPEDDVVLSIALFASMIFGMLGQVYYRHYSLSRSERRKRKIDWGRFIAPVCASPIVFMPLMVALQNADIDLRAMTAPRLMVFIVAFQNGFFWKEHFDRQRADLKRGLL